MGGFWYAGTNEVTGLVDGAMTPGAITALDDMKNGATIMRFGGQGVSVSGRGGAMNTKILGQVGIGGAGAGLLSAISPVASMYFGYQGYKGNMSDRSGISGLMDAVSIDYGTMLGLNMFVKNKPSPTATVAGTTTPTVKGPGFFRMTRVAMGAGVGASIGNAVLGTPGSVIGGIAGAATMANPIVAGAAVAGAVAGYGTYSILKTGYRHGRSMRLGNVPHTAGDMSAFFTQNAFTMRSQSVQAMRNSHMNARSALGQEATFMHTRKNYFSTYR